MYILYVSTEPLLCICSLNCYYQVYTHDVVYFEEFLTVFTFFFLNMNNGQING